jgi:hypothetical protein
VHPFLEVIFVNSLLRQISKFKMTKNLINFIGLAQPQKHLNVALTTRKFTQMIQPVTKGANKNVGQD